MLLLVGTVLGFLVVAELALRLTVGPDLAAIYRIDERYLHRLAPGAIKRTRRLPINGSDRIEVRINGSGMRGPDLVAAPSSGRIVVYGDSFIAAEFSEREHTFAARLAASLADAGVELQVLNAGVPAYGPDQISLRISDELPRLRPDLAIVALYAGNDFGELVRNKIYKLDDEGRIFAHPFEIHPELRSSFERARRQLVLVKLAEKALYNWAAGDDRTGDVVVSRTVSGVPADRHQRVESWLQQRRKEYRRYVIEGDPTVTNLLGDTYDADVSTDPEGDSTRYKMRLMDGVLSRIAATCAEQGVPLLLVFIPSPIDVDPNYAYAQVDPDRHPAYRRRANTEALADIARRHRIPHVDLFQPFLDHGPGELYFRGGDDHWNDTGQRLAARIVATYLLRGGHLHPHRRHRRADPA